MSKLIKKSDIDYISAPIAPVLKGENVHYEYVAFRKQIEDISPVSAIPISVIEQIKAEIENHCCFTAGTENDPAITIHDVFEIIDHHIKEYTE